MKQKDIYFADIETTAFKDNLDYESIDSIDFKLACCIKINDKYDSIESKHSFEQLDDFIDFLILPSKFQKVFYFHNLSFDSKIFISNLYKKGLFEIELMKVQSKILQIIVRKKSDKKKRIIVRFVDTLCLLLKKLKDLGNMVNLEKLEFDFDYSNKEQMEKAKEYCLRDCEIPFRVMLKIIEFVKKVYDIDLTIATIPLTIGSLAKLCFKKIYPNAYQQHNIYLDYCNLREYYFGGRVEVFDFMKENSECFDINSSYPYCFSIYDFANDKIFRTNVKNINDYSVEMFENDDKALAIECEITEQNNDYPFYPQKVYNDNNNYKVYYALGNKKALITKQDIKFFKENNMLDKSILINRILTIYYCNNITDFHLFVYPLYAEKISFEKTHPFVYISKIFLNSGYGKFGQSIERDKFILHSNIDNIDLDEREIYIQDDYFMERITYIQSFQDDNLINAILTCSYGRLELYKWIMRFKEKDYKIKYVDSDSVIVKQDDSLPKIETSNKLGDIKCEYIIQNFQAVDSKEYHGTIYDSNQKESLFLKHKGLQLKRIKEKQNLREYYENGLFNMIIPNIFGCLARHKPINSTFTIKKQKHTYYFKREIRNDLSTIPIHNENTNSIYKLNNELIIKRIIQKL